MAFSCFIVHATPWVRPNACGTRRPPVPLNTTLAKTSCRSRKVALASSDAPKASSSAYRDSTCTMCNCLVARVRTGTPLHVLPYCLYTSTIASVSACRGHTCPRRNWLTPHGPQIASMDKGSFIGYKNSVKSHWHAASAQFARASAAFCAASNARCGAPLAAHPRGGGKRGHTARGAWRRGEGRWRGRALSRSGARGRRGGERRGEGGREQERRRRAVRT